LVILPILGICLYYEYNRLAEPYFKQHNSDKAFYRIGVHDFEVKKARIWPLYVVLFCIELLTVITPIMTFYFARLEEVKKCAIISY
jgi:hypothetical protein